tara:strand:+ start:30059 stop:30247 length:189 start_codon:yes stop_codon:yes gene_type:complete
MEIKTELKKPFQLYITDTELEKLKLEKTHLQKILKKKLTISKLIRIKLKLNGDLEEIKNESL